MSERALAKISPEEEAEDEEGRDGRDDVAHLDLGPVHHGNVLTRINLKIVLSTFLGSKKHAPIKSTSYYWVSTASF